MKRKFHVRFGLGEKAEITSKPYLSVTKYETSQVYCIKEKSYDAAIFLKFLQSVLDIYPTAKIIMEYVLDEQIARKELSAFFSNRT